MRGTRLHRLLTLIALLRGPASWNTRRLAERFQTSRRNIHRDIDVLKLTGVPVYFDAEHGQSGGYKVRDGFFFPHVGLTEQEGLDLALLTKLAETNAVPLLNSAVDACGKLLSTISPQPQRNIRNACRLFDVLGLGVASHNQCRHVMLALQKSLLTRHQIEGTYQGPHQPRAKRIRLQPRCVFLAGSGWYLAAYDNASHKTKLFRVARFREIKTLDRPNTVSPGFDLHTYLGNAWCVLRGERDWKVEILFRDPVTAAIVEESRWHRTQQFERRRDGSLVFRATVSGLEEIKHWILGWGPAAKVLKPAELSAEVRRLAMAIVEPPASLTNNHHSTKEHV